MYKRVKGTKDILPPESSLWQAIEEKTRKVFARYCFYELRTPILEPYELFVRSVGEGSDIVLKEMYELVDKKGRRLVLRPEGTASVARAVIENGLLNTLPLKLYYLGPFFRYERPQKGRFRQFHQIGAEVIGDNSLEGEVELVDLLLSVLKEVGLDDLRVVVNSLGDVNERIEYTNALREYLAAYESKLSKDSRERLSRNPLRILDSKDPVDIKILEKAPSILDYLDKNSINRLEQLIFYLSSMGWKVESDPRLVRGIDYYTGLVFEVLACGDLSIAGGGRYDNLIEELGGKQTPAVGFAIGMERVVDLVDKNIIDEDSAKAVLVAFSDVPRMEVFDLLATLRNFIPTEVAPSYKSIGKAIKWASRRNAKFVIILGEQELSERTVKVKILDSGSQYTLKREELGAFFGGYYEKNMDRNAR